MFRPAAIKILILLFFSVSALAQKPKYKDIYGLLSTKQYQAAEPFLKKYLATEQDNPNAFLFMGLIYQQKTGSIDILKETGAVLSTIDSAMAAFGKAAAMLDERELRRNKEYYEAYNRRDLRSGEFGVNLSDIQFDLQKKKEGLEALAANIKMVKHYFVTSDSQYRKCGMLYAQLKARYPTEQALLLQSNDSTISLLSALNARFDSTVLLVRLYRSSMEGLGKRGYQQELALQDIDDYATHGDEAADFFAERIRLWNYGAFSRRITQVITDEIRPLRTELVRLDAEVNKLIALPDSIFVAGEAKKIEENLPYEQAQKFDTNSLALNLLELKLAALRYRDVVLTSDRYADSLDVNLQLKLVSDEHKALRMLDSVLNVVRQTDIGLASRNYEHFVTTAYGGPQGVKDYVQELTVYAESESNRIADTMRVREDAVRWIRLQEERIPLVRTDSLLPYLPLVTVDERYTVGLRYTDSTDISGYFYSVTPSRIPDIRVTFPVDKPNFLSVTTPSSFQAMVTDSNDLVYYVLVYSEALVDDKFPATIAKVYRADGLSWSANHPLDFAPETLEYNADSGDLLLGGPGGQLVFDKNGNVKQK